MSVIRNLAGGSSTLEQVRSAVLTGPPQAHIALLRAYAPGTPVRFPLICPHCGLPANGILRIERAFRFHVPSGSDTPDDTLQSIDAFDVPYCYECIRQQSQEQVAPSPWTPLRRLFSSGEGAASVVVFLVALFFFKEAASKLSIVPFLMGCFPLTIGLWLFQTTWKKSAFMAIAKPTSVDLSVDFTPCLSLAFEPGWQAFEFRSANYTELFRQANAAILWNPHSAEAQTAQAQRNRESRKTNLIFGAVMAVLAIWLLWKEFS